MKILFILIFLSDILKIYQCFQCFEQLPENTYCDETFECQYCQNTLCQTCETDLLKCITCKNNYYFFYDNCYEYKPNGTFCDQNSKICEKCSQDQCEVCDESKDICTKCFQNLENKFNYQNKCLKDKPPNTKCDENNICSDLSCQDITQNCIKCDENTNLCTECLPGYYLLNIETPKCVQKFDVPSNFFCDDSLGLCYQCSDECSTCQDQKDKCLSCKDSYYFFYDNKCSLTQPIGTFCLNLKCQKCKDDKCKFCDSSLNNCEICLDKNYLYQSQCFDQKPKGVFCDNNNKCKSCSDECDFCQDFKDKCLSCKYSSHFFFDNKCSLTQPNGTFCINQQCQKCNDDKCKLCDSSLNVCEVCNDNYFLFESQCFDQKPKGAFCDDNSKKCFKCSDECGTCQDFKDKCLSCKDSSYFLFNNKCYSTQPIGTFCINQQCQKCNNDKCKFCDSSLSNCEICLDDKYLFESQCLDQKPNGAFCDDSSKVCYKCSDECSSCQDFKDKCLSCKDSNYFFFDKKCSLTQPTGTFCANQLCQKCSDDKCKFCDSSLSACEVCNDNYFLYQTQCFVQKPNGVFCDDKNRCEKCSDECDSCQDFKEKCLSCKNSSYFLFDNKCSSTQPNGTFCINQQCQKCNVNKCKFCDSSLSNCEICLDNNYLFESQCFDSKPKGTFCDESSKKCFKCSDKCDSCQDYKDKCLSCKGSNYFLFDNKCSLTQPNGTFCVNQKCQKCVNNKCKFCDSSLSNCEVCNDNNYLFESQCYDYKPKGVFCDEKNRCERCLNSQCYDCSENKNSCISCDQNSNYKYFYYHQCLDSIPQNTLCNAQNICRNTSCPSQCEICDQYNSCQQCKASFYLLIKETGAPECIDQSGIPPNFFCDGKRICKQCSQQCNTCIEDQDKCTSCNNNYFLYNNQCFKDHPNGTGCNHNRHCLKCQISNCKKCLSTLDVCETYESGCENNQDNCFECLEDQYFYENKCHDKKPKNVYCHKQDKLQVCQICHQTCYKCFGPSEKQCESCYPNSVLSKNQCIKVALDFNSTISFEQVLQIEKQIEITSLATSTTSMILSVSSNMVLRSSFGLVISGMASQKITYMILVNTSLPPAVFTLLKSIQDQLPQQQMSFMNVITKIFDLSSDEIHNYLDIRFESIQLCYNILNNCGQGIFIFTICSFLFLLSFFVLEKLSIKSISNIYLTIYSKLICGLIIQYFQICLSIFVVGVNSQILEYINEKDHELSGVKIVTVILLIIKIFFIFYLLYKYLNYGKMQKGLQNFYEITREKILNETIFESKIRRNFILIYLLSESVIIPTIFIQFYFNPISTSILAIAFQLIFLAIILKLRPFHSKLTNGYFIVSFILWVSLYLIYLFLNIYSSKSDANEFALCLDKLTWIFYYVILIILLSNPVYMVLTILNKLVDFISQKIAERKKNQQLNEMQQSIQLQNNLNSIQYMDYTSRVIQINDISSREMFQSNSENNRKNRRFKKFQ